MGLGSVVEKWVQGRRGRLAALVSLIGGVLWVTVVPASASGTTITQQQAASIFAAAVKATAAAPSFVASGTGTTGNQKIVFRVALSAPSAKATLRFGANAIALRRIGTNVYQYASQQSLEANGVSKSDAAKVADRWVQVPASDKADISSLMEFLSVSDFIKQIVPAGSVSDARRSTLAGQPVYVIDGTFQGQKAVIYVSAKGPSRLVRIDQPSGSDRGKITISNYGQPVNVPVPTNVIAG